MGSRASRTLELVAALGRADERVTVAKDLAAHLGAGALLLLLRDPEVDAMVPAPGFARTLRGGPLWREFVKACGAPGRHSAQVDLPAGTRLPATAIVRDGLAAVLVDGAPDEEALADLERLLPLLAALLRTEQQALLATAESALARRTAVRAQALADALEEARAEGARLNARLSEEHRQKDDFLAMLAHELRNPLTPLVVAIELLRRNGSDPSASAGHLNVMARQVRQLTRLVEDLLDVSRVSRGRIDLRLHPLSLNEVVRDAVEANRPLLEARRSVIALELPPEALMINGDGVRLAQVFANLLHNAIKFTQPGGHIEIRAARDGEEALVTVKDDGAGISPAMLPRIFDLFTQAPVTLDRSQGGLGIGLTLVRALVDLHGGSVSAASDGPGRGSTFTLRLPLLRERVAPAVAAPAPPAAPAGNPERTLRVLVVDDNRDGAETLAAVLRLTGHHPEVAYSGPEALALAPQFDPDLVLLDIGLPGIDGYEVARRMRRTLPRAVRLVAITGYGTPEDKRRSREAGFDEHLVKPVMPEALEEVAGRARAGGDVATSC